MNKVLFIIGLLITINTSAQTLPQSRFIGGDQVNCARCNIAEDGVIHFRLNPDTVEVVTENAQGQSIPRSLKWAVEVRNSGSRDAPLAYVTGLARFAYNVPALGIFTNTRNISDQCEVQRSDEFNRRFPAVLNSDGDPIRNRYTSRLRGGLPGNLFSYVEQSAAATADEETILNYPTISNYVSLTDSFKTFLTITCMIADDEEDAGLGISRNLAVDNVVRNFASETRNSEISPGRPIFPLADNDLRGFRLDGKTWAEDYSRHGDGRGVRLRFSKGIETQLDSDNFSLDVSTQTLIFVNHDPGSPNVEITFSDVVENDILRLSNTTTNVIRDANRETLAPGNFVASLFYDEAAPTATTVLSNGNEHTISFGIPIRVPPAGNGNDYLCVTEENGLCVPVPTIPITITTSTQVAITTSTQLTFAFEDIPDTNALDSPFKRGGTRSIEFRRNAILGENFKIVEDYQTKLRDALFIPDLIGAGITISNVDDTRNNMNADSFTITFDVEADEPVTNLAKRASYNINVMGINAITTPTSVTPLTGTGTTQVRVVYTVALGNQRVSDIRSYTLNIDEDQLLDSGDNTPFFTPVEETLSALSCASFYPNIGQQTLYFRLDSTDFDGTLTIGTMLEENVTISEQFSVNLDREIMSRGNIVAVYTTSDGVRNEATCMANLTRDMDQDGVPDIVDSSPFDASVSTPNSETTGGQEAETPSLEGRYFSRETVIRSLIGEGEFTFVDPNFSGKQTFKRISSDEYFGINTDDDTQIFRYGPSNGECEMVLDEALEYNLSKVKIDEFCQDNRVLNFASEQPRVNQEYIWVTVEDGILQVSTTSTEITTESSYFGYSLSILPEINFSGQPSYIFAEATTQTAVISAYRGTESGAPTLRVVDVRARSSDIDEIRTNVQFSNQDIPIVNSEYTIASPNTLFGETIVHWLAGDVVTIWAPTSATANAMLPANGYDISGFTYAIGSDNNIDVRVAGPDDPEITRIRQIVLYEILGNNTLRRVSSVIAGRSYYVIADYDTNSPDEISIITDPMLVSGYTDTETSATQFAMRTGSINFIGQARTAIEISEIVAPTTGTGTITVGWSRIGNIPNIRAVYLVSPDEPPTYSVVDASNTDVFGTPAPMFNPTNTALPVDIEGAEINNNDILRAHAGDEQAPLSVFFTHYSHINATDEGGQAEGGQANDYSATIDIDDESDETQLELQGSIEAGVRLIATFGVRDVDYGFNDGDSIEADDITGGTIYATFPIKTPILNMPETLYVGKYGSRDDRSDGDSAEGGTWYVIKRENTSAACPTNLQFYINNQEPVDENGGFSPSADNCIMLVITDGGIFDASSREGIIIDPVGISNEILPSAESILETSSSGEGWYRFTRNSDYVYKLSDRRRGGGGAIDTSDALLLIGALIVLLIATTGRRRRTLHNS